MQDFYSIIGEDPANDATTDKRLFRYDDLVAGFINFSQKHIPDGPEKAEKIHRNAQNVLKRIFLAWASNDGDLHAKNFSALLRINPDTKTITDVEFAPTYDSCPSVFAGKDGGPMYYNFQLAKGQPFEMQPNKNLNLQHFLAFLKNPRLSIGDKKYCIFDTEQEATTFIRDIASKVAFSAVDSYNDLPEFIHGLKDAPILKLDMQMAAAIAVERARKIGAKTPDIDFDPNLLKMARDYGARARKQALGDEERVQHGRYEAVCERALQIAQNLLTPVFREPAYATVSVTPINRPFTPNA
jgi:hypothetical protein